MSLWEDTVLDGIFKINPHDVGPLFESALDLLELVGLFLVN